MEERRTWEQMKQDNVGADWIDPNGEFCGQYVRISTSAEVNAILDKRRSRGVKEWQSPGFNGCWSCDRVLSCHFGINAE